MNNINYTPVKNFPIWFPWYKKLWANITYFISQIPLYPRKNKLSRNDIHEVWNKIQPWDIILVWNFQYVSGIAIEWVVTHALSYTRKWRCIHAFAHGVSYIWLRKVCRIYDTLFILRPCWKNHNQRYIYLNHLVEKVGKPYDFFFWLKDSSEETFFCTELINKTLLEIGYETWLKTLEDKKNLLDIALDKTMRAHRILLPKKMLEWNFEIIFSSHNLRKWENRWEII